MMKVNIGAPSFSTEEEQAVLKVMRSGILAQGPEVRAFEEEFSELVDGASSVAVNSGTSALHLGLLAAGIGPGDEVIVPAFSFAASANAIALTGAVPKFADIDPRTFCISHESARGLINSNTKGILVVHLYGQPAEMSEFSRLANEFNLMIFEDAAQAHGAKFAGTPVGSQSKFAAFSFYPTKNMTAGEGGMITSRDQDLLRMARLLRNQGMAARYDHQVVGFNNRMTDIHAAIGRVQLKKLSANNETRIKNAEYYAQHLRGVLTPFTHPLASHVFHQYTLRIPASERDQFMAELNEKGVETGIYYPKPINELPAYQIDADTPHSKLAAQEVISIPVHPTLSQSQLEYVVDTINKTATAGS